MGTVCILAAGLVAGALSMVLYDGLRYPRTTIAWSRVGPIYGFAAALLGVGVFYF